MSKLTLSLDFDERELKIVLIKEVSKKINSILFSLKTGNILKAQIEDFIDRQIRSSPEFSSLLSGELRAVFGLPDASSILESILATIKRNVQIDIIPAKATINGISPSSITVSILRDDYQDLFSTAGTSYQSKGGQVEWLKWLLTKGDSIILADYSVEMNVNEITSRTRQAIMVKSNQGFRVPPEFSGTSSNNWLTRCFEDTEEIVGNILRLELQRRFS